MSLAAAGRIILAGVVGLSPLFAAAPASSLPPPHSQPALVTVTAEDLSSTPAVTALIAEIRQEADAFIFLCGGASKMPDAAKAQLVRLFDALAILSRRGVRFAVADGGTQAGIMEAAGLARRASGQAFPLIGISPAPDITTTGEAGKVPVDPNHSHIVAVRNPSWERDRRTSGWMPSDGHWGSETETMYRVFAKLAEGRPSVTLVANGGDIVLDEVRANVDAGRPMILVAGSGRAADAMVSLLKDAPATDDETRRLRTRAQALRLTGRRDLYHVFDIGAGPEALATMLASLLERRAQP